MVGQMHYWRMLRAYLGGSRSQLWIPSQRYAQSMLLTLHQSVLDYPRLPHGTPLIVQKGVLRGEELLELLVTLATLEYRLYLLRGLQRLVEFTHGRQVL